MFNFTEIEVPVERKNIAPGYHTLTTGEVKFVALEGKTPRIELQLLDKDKNEINQNFFITEKSAARLQYLFFGLTGKKLDRKFENTNQIGEFFVAAFNNKHITKQFVVGAKEAPNGKAWPELPYLYFVIPEEMNVVEGPFEEGSSLYNRYLVKNTAARTVASSNATNLSSEVDFGGSNDDDSMPF